MATHSSILAWRMPQRNLVGYRPWDHKESDTTEKVSTWHTQTEESHFPGTSLTSTQAAGDRLQQPGTGADGGPGVTRGPQDTRTGR